VEGGETLTFSSTDPLQSHPDLLHLGLCRLLEAYPPHVSIVGVKRAMRRRGQQGSISQLQSVVVGEHPLEVDLRAAEAGAIDLLSEI
jgi:hypothetical protein